MADAYIDVGITADETTLADNAVARLQAVWEDWEPAEGDLALVMIEALAQMAADAATVAGVMPAAAFQTLIAELFQVERNEGTPATTTVTFTLLDADPHTIPSGAEIDIDGYAFVVDDDTPTNALTETNVPVTCDTVGTQANGLTGDAVAMITSLAFVTAVAVEAPTAGGTDPETDESYRDKGSRELELQAKTLVTGRDYELMALSNAAVDRVVAQANLPTRQITVTGSASNGDALPTAVKNELLAEFNRYRQTTWTVSMGDPTKTNIDVAFTVKIEPGYVASGVIAEATQAIRDFLDPARWGVPAYARDPVGTWYIEPRVRRNEIISRLGQVHGVDYVVSVTINGSAGAVDAPTGDWVMPGTVPLPSPLSITGTAA